MSKGTFYKGQEEFLNSQYVGGLESPQFEY